MVFNPNFEEYYQCPQYPGNVYANGWEMYYTPDYFNTCEDSLYIVSVPYNCLGYQNALSGDGYCGLFTYGTTYFPNYREILYCQLLNPLVAGNKYYIRFYVSLADQSNCATNNIGVLLTTTYVDFSGYPIPLTNYSNLKSHSIILDLINWTKIDTAIIADSSYLYLYIGSFYDNLHTDSILFNPLFTAQCATLQDSNRCISYYYIENVCVAEDSNDCNLISVNKIKEYNNNFNAYYNPYEKAINFEFDESEYDLNSIYVELYNTLGIMQSINVLKTSNNRFKIFNNNQT
ncbi:MAG: hypothetical protein HY738_07855, partial [Bacteroidia bacterium]|nr:hypothetical protein [Bacteroidia bacterium]